MKRNLRHENFSSYDLTIAWYLVSSEWSVNRYFVIDITNLYLSAMHIFVMVIKFELLNFKFNAATRISSEVLRL